MTQKKQIEALIKALRGFRKPKAFPEFLAVGDFVLRDAGGGCSRFVYKVVGLPVVVKINGDDDPCHANDEVRAIRAVMRYDKYKPLRRFCPKVYYHTSFTGLTIMEYVPLCVSYYEAEEAENVWCSVLGGGPDTYDIDERNVRKTKRGGLRIIDFGLFYAKEENVDEENSS